jgi:hypothetical protein
MLEACELEVPDITITVRTWICNMNLRSTSDESAAEHLQEKQHATQERALATVAVSAMIAGAVLV